METWTHGHIDTGTHGHVDTWTHGHKDTDTGNTYTWTHVYTEIWRQGIKIFVNSEVLQKIK
jgi:hypothetical protein